MASQEGRYYSDISSIEVAFSPEEANRKLDSGYELLKIEIISAEQSPEARRLAFVLGRKKETTNAVSKQAPHPQAESSKYITIPESIPWTQKTEGFAWPSQVTRTAHLLRNTKDS